MGMSRHFSSELKAEPNLTPMLDMVFQLITFFMLVINFKSAEIDLSLKLPVVGSARPVDTKGQRELLVLNIDNTGDLKIYGRSVANIEGYIRNEAQVSMMASRLTQADLEAGEELPTTIVVRADRATPFKMLNRVIKACQESGFRKFALKALDKEG
jgi:biopolymer transport protein ExbD